MAGPADALRRAEATFLLRLAAGAENAGPIGVGGLVARSRSEGP